jgi:hypothetical protein
MQVATVFQTMQAILPVEEAVEVDQLVALLHIALMVVLEQYLV